jgi:uncharacterized protein YcfJ
MLRTLTLAAAATSLLAATTLPADASARTRHHYTHKTCRSAANTGTVVGAVGGGLLGHSLGNHGTGSTLLGAGLGGVAGHQIAKSNCKSHHR